MMALTVTPLPAQEIGLRTGKIGVEIAGAEASKPDVALYWGDEDGGTQARQWDHVLNFRAADNGPLFTTLTDLNVNTPYYYRAFALNILAGISQWSDVGSFTTLPPGPAQLQATPVSLVGGTVANLSGQVTETGGEIPNITIVAGPKNEAENFDAWPLKFDLGPQEGAFSTRLEGLSPATEYFYRVVASNASGRTWTPIERFTTAATPPLHISEFMASNEKTALSRLRTTPDGAFPRTQQSWDWIEIQNATNQAWDLSGYHLTDNSQLPMKWQFPAGTSVPANGFLVVYASGNDVRDPRLDEQGRLHTNFELSRDGEYLALTNPSGDVVHAYDNPPPQWTDVSYGTFASKEGRFAASTPGASNQAIAADVTDVSHEWVTTDATKSLRVTATVASTLSAVTEVQLHYRAMLAPLQTLAMHDDGRDGDVKAGDGIFTALIPGDLATPGQMLRYYVTAASQDGLLRREPMFVNPTGSPEYYGTMVDDPTLQSSLPILHRFVENTRRIDTAAGTRASIFYRGEFYDNVFIRIRGGTARDWPKKSYKVEFNGDHLFELDPSAPRVTEVDLNATYTDKSYLRAEMTAKFQEDVGTPTPDTYHVRMQQNGEFFSVALMVEQPDDEFLARNGLDPEGSLYKANPGSYYTTGGTGSFEKKTRRDEDRSDITALVAGLNLKDATELEKFLFDNIDLPAQINFLATHVITQNIDGSDKNHFIYRDTNGTGEWQMLPWDLDLTFGPDALNTDFIAADENTRGASNPMAVHPFLGARSNPLHAGKINMLIDGIVNNPRTREMFLRRIRTLADQYLATGYFQQYIDQMVQLLKDDVPVDRAKWKAQSHFGGGTAPAFETVAERIKTQYLDRRLAYLTQYHVNQGVGIPQAQPTDAAVQFGDAIEFNPASGRLGDEYFTIQNPHDYAVDLSGWQIRGSVNHVFKPGTVLGAKGTLYMAADVRGFRARESSPSGKQGLFVQGYATELPNTGGALELISPQGIAVARQSFGTQSVPASAANLRISEIHYAPTDGVVGYGEMVVGGGQYEFVEVTNISSQPIELAGVRFQSVDVNGDAQGIDFEFASQTLPPYQSAVVVKDRAAFATRYASSIRMALGDDNEGGESGEFSGRLSDSGEQLTLVDAMGQTIHQLTYADRGDWSEQADGWGSSLEWIGGDTNASDARSWRPSVAIGGSPGQPHRFAETDVLINEVLANEEAPQTDRIELYNTLNTPIDITGWSISDSRNQLKRFVIPTEMATLAAKSYLVLDRTQLGFGLKADAGELLVLVVNDPNGKPIRFADAVTYPATAVNQSSGRVPDGGTRWTTLTANSFGSTNGPGVSTRPQGDFNGDRQFDRQDLALLCAAVTSASNDLKFDLTGDQKLDDADVDAMVEDVLFTSAGDVNFDGIFSSADLLLIMQAGRYEQPADAETDWLDGDWNCDGKFDSQDLVKAAVRGYRA